MAYAGCDYSQQAWDSGYDSTWEGDEEDEQPKTEKVPHQDASPKPNLLFYQNKIPFKPNGEYIDKIHKCWLYDYDTLENNHNFIQWLFPLRERGTNSSATPLTLSEIQMMKRDEEVMKRLLESYKLMLGFYGIVLLDPDTGTVARAKENWKDRFKNLNNNTHNNLRITRMLTCLGEMGFEKFQAPLVRFFLEETLCNGNLPNVKISALEYFMFTVKNKKQRRNLVHFAWVHYKPQDRFIWGPLDKLQKFNPEPGNAEQKGEVDIAAEREIPSKNDSLEDYCVGDTEATRREPENERERGIVRRTAGFISRSFLFFFNCCLSPFLPFFRWFLRHFRYFFRGCIFWFRGEARNEDRLNEEQFSVKTESVRTEKIKDADMANVNISVEHKYRSQGFMQSELECLLKDPERQKSHKVEIKELNVSADVTTDNSMNESFLTSGNDWLEGREEGNEKEGNDTENGEVSGVNTKNNGTDNYSGDRECGGTGITNTENQTWETKIYNGKTEDEGLSKVKQSVGEDDAESTKIKIQGHRETSAVWSKDNDQRDIGTQNILFEKDKTDQIEKDDGKTKNEEATNTKLSAQFGEETDEDESQGTSKMGEKRGTLVLGSEDNNGGTIGSQNILPETDKKDHVERDDGKTKDEEAANAKLSPPVVEEGEEDESSGISKMGDIRETLVQGSGDNDGGSIGTQNTLPETDEKDHVERDDGKTKDEEAANAKLSPQLCEEGEEDESAGTSKMGDKRRTLVLGSGDNERGTVGSQNILHEINKKDHVERDDGKTKDEEAANAKLSPQLGEEGEEEESSGIRKMEDIRRTLVQGSGDNDGRSIGTQSTLPETDEKEQFERDNGKAKDEEAGVLKPGR